MNSPAELLMASLHGRAMDAIARERKEVEDWKDQFAENPVYALGWSRNPSYSVMRLQVLRELEHLTDIALDPDNPATCQGVASRIIRNGEQVVFSYCKRALSRSTSTLDNLQEEIKARVWAEILDPEGFTDTWRTTLNKILAIPRDEL